VVKANKELLAHTRTECELSLALEFLSGDPDCVVAPVLLKNQKTLCSYPKKPIVTFTPLIGAFQRTDRPRNKNAKIRLRKVAQKSDRVRRPPPPLRPRALAE
jgi:hypothetical protein